MLSLQSILVAKHIITYIMNNILKNLRLIALSVLAVCAVSVFAKDYTYLNEGFEEDVWSSGKASVASSTGDWIVNKNKSTNSEAYSGASSLEFTYKDGITSPKLSKGAGAIVYYALDTNRQVYVEKSIDGNNWIEVENYKETSPWTRHIVMINDPDTRFIRFRTTSNKQFFIDDVLITLPDGTDGEGQQIISMEEIPYFTNTFENSTLYPSSKEEALSEKAFSIEGQGEWLYYNAYRNTNESYIPDGSKASLRMLKNGSYVITPVLNQGVVSIKFDEGRTGKKLVVYASGDAGQSWEQVYNIVSDTHNEICIQDKSLNRIKIANESTSDADIDNIEVFAYPEGTPASLQTKDATEITASSAIVGGTVLSGGDRYVSSVGICWTLTGTPDIHSDKVEGSGDDFSVALTGLPAASLISYRAYAVSLAGVSYGETKCFTTAGAVKPTVTASAISIIDDLTTETSIAVKAPLTIVDDGGAAITSAGYKVETSSLPSIEVEAYPENDNIYNTIIQLLPAIEYTLTPFAENERGRAYGFPISYTTPDINPSVFAHKIFYCDPSGDDSTADGSIGKPFFNLQKAVDLVAPGDTIFMNGGTYRYSSRINVSAIGEKNSGKICLFSRNGRAVLDFSDMNVADNNQGMRLTGSYWHIYGIDICNAGDNGLLIERNKPSGGSYSDIAANTQQGHHNIIENCSFYRNADTGLQMKNLAAYNLVINCDSYFNIDPGEGNADGFAVKISHGDGNYFYGCRAWRNSDDGWDQFIKKEGGFPDDITTTLDNCWAFENGFLENGNPCSGNGNGFKMGSDQGRNNVILNRCLAFDNLQKGFDQNHNSGHMILNNCTGYSAKYIDNKSHYTYRIDEPVAAGHIVRFTNCVAISDGIADRNKSAYAPYSIVGEQVTCDFNTLPDDFLSISTEGMDGARDAYGNLPVLDFMKIRPDNDRLIDKGTVVTPFAGESLFSKGIKYSGIAPDLGCFETESEETGVKILEENSSKANLSATLSIAQCGLVIVQLENVETSEQSSALVFDRNGICVAAEKFTGPSVAIDLSGRKGIFFIQIASSKGQVTLKHKI